MHAHLAHGRHAGDVGCGQEDLTCFHVLTNARICSLLARQAVGVGAGLEDVVKHQLRDVEAVDREDDWHRADRADGSLRPRQPGGMDSVGMADVRGLSLVLCNGGKGGNVCSRGVAIRLVNPGHRSPLAVQPEAMCTRASRCGSD